MRTSVAELVFRLSDVSSPNSVGLAICHGAAELAPATQAREIIEDASASPIPAFTN